MTQSSIYFESGIGKSNYPNTVEDHYIIQYFEALDLLIICIKDWFDQPGCQVYSKLESLLLDAANGLAVNEDCLSEMMDLYATDFNSSMSQLQVLETHFSDSPKPVRLSSIQEFIIGLSNSQPLLSETIEDSISYASHTCNE